jgi:hypothetical protein
MRKPLKKSENLRDICTRTSLGLSINTMHDPIQSRETVPLNHFLLFVMKIAWDKIQKLKALFAVVEIFSSLGTNTILNIQD